MQEISSFVDSGLRSRVESFPTEESEGSIHRGMAAIFKRIDDSLQTDEQADVETLLDFAKRARDSLENKSGADKGRQ